MVSNFFMVTIFMMDKLKTIIVIMTLMLGNLPRIMVLVRIIFRFWIFIMVLLFKGYIIYGIRMRIKVTIKMKA